VLLRRPQRGELLVEAQGADFGFGPGRAAVLEGVSTRLHAGDHVLLEGPSGGGKSTLAALLAGLHLPTKGLLLASGLDRHTLGHLGWRRRVVAAPQSHENHLLQGSLAFNLLFGCQWPATAEELADAKAICAELGLQDLIARMPQGLHQAVGSVGWRLSQGERSRVFIARALLQGSELVVLDESFAVLDPDTLAKAMACVRKRARTLLVVAHP
jgi:ATP-binding cassette subfamily B protein